MQKLIIIRAQFSADRGISSRAAEFGFLRPEPRNLPRNSPFCRGIRLFPVEFVFFRGLSRFSFEQLRKWPWCWWL